MQYGKLMDTSKRVFLRPYRSHVIDSVGSLVRYRVVSSVCDIEVSKSLYDFLSFLSSKIGGEKEDVIKEYSARFMVPEEKVSLMWQLLEEKGLILPTPVSTDQEEKEHRNRTRTLWLRTSIWKTKGQWWKTLGRVLLKKEIIVGGLLLALLADVVFFIMVWRGAVVWEYWSAFDYLWIVGITFLFTLWHEMGHISAAKYYGMKGGEIGIGVYYFFVVAYADVHEVWELPRKQRMVVAVAGVYAQILVFPLIVALALWSHSAMLRDLILFLHVGLLMVVNPFLKMDGYWLLSHYLGVTSLHQRLKAYVKRIFSSLVKGARRYPDPFVGYPRSVKRVVMGYLIAVSVAMVVFWGMYISYTLHLIHEPERYFYRPWRNLWGATLFSREWAFAFNTLFRNLLFVVSLVIIAMRGLVNVVKRLLFKGGVHSGKKAHSF